MQPLENFHGPIFKQYNFPCGLIYHRSVSDVAKCSKKGTWILWRDRCYRETLWAKLWKAPRSVKTVEKVFYKRQGSCWAAIEGKGGISQEIRLADFLSGTLSPTQIKLLRGCSLIEHCYLFIYRQTVLYLYLNPPHLEPFL